MVLVLRREQRPINQIIFNTLLRTYEDELGLGSLNQNDMKAQAIDDVWTKN